MAEFDAEPIPNIEAVINKCQGTNVDYRQIWLSKTFKLMTAFENSMGLFLFNIMPFSLVYSCRHVLQVNVTGSGQCPQC